MNTIAKPDRLLIAIPDRLLKVTEVARHLSLSRSKVYGMMDAGELAYIKFGKSRRVKAEDVARLIAVGTVRSST